MLHSAILNEHDEYLVELELTENRGLGNLPERGRELSSVLCRSYKFEKVVD